MTLKRTHNDNHFAAQKLLLAFFVFGLAFMLAACAPYQAKRKAPLRHSEGLASWYGPGFHGRKTASGERYNQNALTAAHRTLPFGSSIKVVNVDNDKSVIVKINDRGPFVKGRIIDLSKAAAKEIGMLGTGTARVELLTSNGSEEDEISANNESDEISDDLNMARAPKTSMKNRPILNKTPQDGVEALILKDSIEEDKALAKRTKTIKPVEKKVQEETPEEENQF